MKCRHCKNSPLKPFLDLGRSPASNAYLDDLTSTPNEYFFPLRVYVCDQCWLVQTEDFNAPNELFSDDYHYLSSTSRSWLEHSKNFCDYITERLNLSDESFVIEIASNDGYLLKNFISKKIPCLGIEPTKRTADIAEEHGVPVLREFFDSKIASQLKNSGRQADLICGNNVYAHVPDINDFTQGLSIALKPNGTITLEFPHILQLISKNQFDTIYHEHYSYLSLAVVTRIFESNGLMIYDVDEIPTHGGSLRVYGSHANDLREPSSNVSRILEAEHISGLQNYSTYENFQAKAISIRDAFLFFLENQKALGKSVAAYGAAAKGNTLLNYCQIVGTDLIQFVCDAAESKQGKFLPGSHIPIMHPSHLNLAKPDYIIIFPWNIADEIIEQERRAFDWNSTFVTVIPKLSLIHS